MKDMKEYYITRDTEGKLTLSDKVGELGKIYVPDVDSIDDESTSGLYIKTSLPVKSDILLEEFVKLLASNEKIQLGLCRHIIKYNIGKVVHFKVVCTNNTKTTITFTVMTYTMVKNIRDYSKYINLPYLRDSRAYNNAISITLRKDNNSILSIDQYNDYPYTGCLSYNSLHMLFLISGIKMRTLCPYICKHVNIDEYNYDSNHYSISYYPVPVNTKNVGYHKNNR